MNIPDTDEDLLGVSSEELDDILRSRDAMIDNPIIPELPLDGSKKLEKAWSPINRLNSTSVYDRLHFVFSTDPVLYDQELNALGRRARKIPVYIGFSIGSITAVMRTIVCYHECINSNHLTVYRSQITAKRRVYDQSFVKGCVFGLSVGFRVTLFTSGCYTLPLIFTAIQGKTSYWEHAVAWGITSSLYCFNRGLKRMLVAGVIGAVPGLIYGLSYLFAARVSDLTFEKLLAKQLATTYRSRL